MGFIQEIIVRHKEKVRERNKLCDETIARVECALQEANGLFVEPQNFVDPQAENEWRNRNSGLLIDTEVRKLTNFKKASRYKILTDKQTQLHDTARSLLQYIYQHNEKAALMKINEAYALIGDVEGRKLDQQQMVCIVKEVRNHLVIAGAGTGKTTTVVGKIKYLLKTGKCLPEDILVLSFTNASASEMSERIACETKHNITASTFHKLGLNIISAVDGIVPKITQISMKKFIKEQLLVNMENDKYLHLLNSYILYNRVAEKSEFEFSSQKEYDEYLALNPPTTVNNETVKSYGEMDIANFLMQNGIRYIYEHPYEIDTRTSEYGQYRPDFYLPDYKIYIEYFGINRDGEVPSYFKSSNGMSASELYRSSMEWKRTIHHQNQTNMVECYAYEKLEGNLLDRLAQKLKAESVVLQPKSSKELWEQIAGEEASVLDGIIELFEMLINLIKSNNYDIAKVRELNYVGRNVRKNNVLLSLLEPIYDAYCQYLTEHEEIDFNDMINTASEYIRQGKYTNPYKYVIVDEYQDISKARFTLLECLRKSNDYKLFCVGDDWQSIYRFAGSDIDFILRFSKYWGPAEISKIETTYRFSQKLIEITSDFVMHNPVQIKKSIKGRRDDIGFPLGEISGYTDKYAIKFMAKKLDDIPKISSVFFIGRYSFDVNTLLNSGLFSCHYNNVSGVVDVEYLTRPDLKMSFLTAHKSKGLQADYIFIVNNKNSRMGFPSKVQDAPILDLLLSNHEQYPYAEERRLFYVALTRAKKKVFLVTINNQESVFACEIKKRYGENLKKEQFECPLCGGRLLKKSGTYGEFFGCSNYRVNGCTYKRNIR